MEKLLPQNIEAECGVLGSIIIDPEAIVQVSDFLRPEDFYRDAHRTIYEIILHLYQSSEPADFITICDELERRGRLEDVGGASYITSLINQVPTSGNVEYYGHIVERTSTLRRLIHAAGQIAAVAYEEADADAALDKAEKLIFDISQRHTRSDFSSMEEILAGYMTKLEQLNARRGTIVGVPSGFTDLDRMTGGLQRSDLIVLAARPGMGKCLKLSSIIDDPATGERLTIEECVKRQLPRIYGLSEQGEVRTAEIGAWIDSGIQPCFRVRTLLGREVEVTGHHPFLTVHGWTPLHDLKVGDSIAIPRQVPVFGHDTSWPLEKVRLLAYYIAEGGLTHTSPVFTNTDPLIVNDFKQIIAEHFPVCGIRQNAISYMVAQPKTEEKRLTSAKLGKNPITLWLTELGLWGKLAKDKFFPPCVWQWDRKRLAEFLRVLMSCDGSIFAQQKHYPRIEFGVASRQLAADVHHAFVRFGIVSKFYQIRGGAWKVLITSAPDIKKYQEEIGWIGEKATRFADYTIKVEPRLSNVGHAPAAIWEMVKAAAQLREMTLIELARQSGETTKGGKFGGYNAHIHRSLSQYRLARYARILEKDNLRRAASPDIYWDPIVSIEPTGEHQVYDLTVPDGQNFVAQDVFVHNTSFALSLAHNTALKYKNSVAVFSLEMSKEQLVQRLLSMDAGIDQQRLRTGWIEEDEWERIVYASDKLSEANIWIDDTAGISTMEMRSKSRRLLAEHGVDLIIVDYLQLMQASANGRSENRVQEVSEISRSLKGLARELNVPVVALSQLSRSVESRQSKVPQLSDLRESGCITGDSLVYLPDTGTHQPIAQLVGKSGFRALALNTETWQLEPHEVTNVFTSGRKPVFRLTTRLGRTIRATANHKFLTMNGWKRLDELEPGIHLALPRGLPGPTQATMSDEELALLGHLIGDGCTLSSHAMQYTTHELELAETVSGLASVVFGDTVIPRIKKERDWYQVYLAPAQHLTHNVHNPVGDWLRKLGVYGLRSHQKFVPEQVFAQPTEGIAKFLRHLWSTDGCINLSTNTDHYPTIYYASSSKKLAKDVQSLLLRLGINANLSRHAQVNKGRDQYHINIRGRADFESFFAKVGALSQKKVLHQDAIVEYFANREERSRDIIPSAAWSLFIMPALYAAGLTLQTVSQTLGDNRSAYLPTRNINRKRVLQLAELSRSTALAQLAQSDVYWDQIDTIEADSEEDIYDLTVDGPHNFVSNYIIVSNSIEQDSDIVMFIYRDDVYNQDSERKNIADLIVAKHRNGPVGEVSLYFQASQTRFRDLEATPTEE
ncbi:MAG TPA: replicative DNA helicase [Ktedonobacteraceae bacterium]